MLSTDVKIKLVGCLVLSCLICERVGVLIRLSFIEYKSYPLIIPADDSSFLIDGTDWEILINDCGSGELKNLVTLGSSVILGNGANPAIGCSCNRSVSGLTNLEVPRLEPVLNPPNLKLGRLESESFPRLLLMLYRELPELPLAELAELLLLVVRAGGTYRAGGVYVITAIPPLLCDGAEFGLKVKPVFPPSSYTLALVRSIDGPVLLISLIRRLFKLLVPLIPRFAYALGTVVLMVNRLLASEPRSVVNPDMFRVEPDSRYSVSRTPPASCLTKLVTLFTPLST